MGLKNAGRRQVASSTGHLDKRHNSYTLVTVFPVTLHSPVQVGIQISGEKWKWVARLSVYGIGVCVCVCLCVCVCVCVCDYLEGVFRMGGGACAPMADSCRYVAGASTVL